MGETVRSPLTFNHTEVRRGFMDVHTPVAALAELRLPPDEQRQLIDSWVKELEAERAGLAGKMGGIDFRRKKNLNYKLNVNPSFRRRVRTGTTLEHYQALGRRIQELQRMSGEIKRSTQSDAAGVEKP